MAIKADVVGPPGVGGRGGVFMAFKAIFEISNRVRHRFSYNDGETRGCRFRRWGRSAAAGNQDKTRGYDEQRLCPEAICVNPFPHCATFQPKYYHVPMLT